MPERNSPGDRSQSHEFAYSPTGDVSSRPVRGRAAVPAAAVVTAERIRAPRCIRPKREPRRGGRTPEPGGTSSSGRCERSIRERQWSFWRCPWRLQRCSWAHCMCQDILQFLRRIISKKTGCRSCHKLAIPSPTPELGGGRGGGPLVHSGFVTNQWDTTRQCVTEAALHGFFADRAAPYRQGNTTLPGPAECKVV